tara:strand:+ start:22669 stop:23073 length:405 start_codon:yes stop_codon:yes gene_type:complete
MARVPLSESMALKLEEGGFNNVYWPVLPEENIKGNAVYIQVTEYDSSESTIQNQYTLSQFQIMIRGNKLTSYIQAWDVADDIRQYLINLPDRFTINGNEYTIPNRINGPTYFKDSNDRDVFIINYEIYQDPQEE